MLTISATPKRAALMWRSEGAVSAECLRLQSWDDPGAVRVQSVERAAQLRCGPGRRRLQLALCRSADAAGRADRGAGPGRVGECRPPLVLLYDARVAAQVISVRWCHAAAASVHRPGCTPRQAQLLEAVVAVTPPER